MLTSTINEVKEAGWWVRVAWSRGLSVRQLLKGDVRRGWLRTQENKVTLNRIQLYHYPYFNTLYSRYPMLAPALFHSVLVAAG